MGPLRRLVPFAIWLAFLGGSVIWTSLIIAERGVSRVWGFMLMPAVWVLNALNAASGLFWWGALALYSMGTGFGIFFTLITQDHTASRSFFWMAVASALHLFSTTAVYVHQRRMVDQELGEEAPLRVKRLMANELIARAVERYWPWLARLIRARASPRH